MELEHPLPPGMRDLLPEEAANRRAIARAVMDRFALYGYRLVTPPAFEFADVIERGLGTLGAADVLRFIEPESGEVAVLRPDMTPQVARIVATRLARDHAPPYRLAYEGTVVRRRIGRAKKHRQIPQVGVELCGVSGAEGDLELLALAADALAAAGLGSFRIDIGDAGIVRGLIEGVAPPLAEEITRALAKKDEAVLKELTARAGDAAQMAGIARVVPLTGLHGGRDALVEATRLVAGTRAQAPASRLLALFDAASAQGLGDLVRADAGEVRGFAYYTGTIFSMYAEGPGEAIGAGGRYDDLLSRFGTAMPAVGFGLDLDAVARALRAVRAGRAPGVEAGVVVVGGATDPRIALLRRRGVPAVAIAERASALEYARAWGFLVVWEGSSEGSSVLDAATAAPIDVAALKGSVPGDDAGTDQVVRVLRTGFRGA